MSLIAQRWELPRAPWDLREAVELYARESGRTASLHFMPGGGWFARFSLRSNDKRMLLWQQGMAAEPPTEDVWFHVPNPREHEGISLSDLKQTKVPICWPVISLKNDRCHMAFIPLDIVQMGTGGVKDFLERGNTWSGRGEFDSIEGQLRAVREANQKGKERFRATQKEESRHEQRDKRRWRLKIPFLRVGIDLGGDQTTKE